MKGKVFFRNIILIFTSILIIQGCGGGTKKINSVQDVYIPDLSVIDKEDLEMGEADFYFRRALYYLKERDCDKALEYLNNSNAPEYMVYSAYGYLYLLKNNWSLSERNFKESLNLNKFYLQSYVGMILLMEKQNRFEESYDFSVKSLDIDPENVWLREKSLSLSSILSSELKEKARVALEKGDNEAYVNALKRLLIYSNNRAIVAKELGDFFYGEKNYDEAIKYYGMIDSLDEESFKRLTEVYELNENYHLAILLYSSRLKKEPGNLEYINKINDLKSKLSSSGLEGKFQSMFLKEFLSREDVAALVIHNFKDYLPLPDEPLIIRDISNSYAMQEIIAICANGIMDVRPDHSFSGKTLLDRISFIDILYRLKNHFLDIGKEVALSSSEDTLPFEIDTNHRYYKEVLFVVRNKLIEFPDGIFCPYCNVSPEEAIRALNILKDLIKDEN